MRKADKPPASDLTATLKNGTKTMLLDTKARSVAPLASKTSVLGKPAPQDPYKAFVLRSCNEKRKKSEIVEDIKKQIESAEADL